MVTRRCLIPLFILCLCTCNSISWGWNSTGHKVVALIAWEDLTPKTRAAVTAILKQHPRYEKDLLLDAPKDQTPDEQARTAFATAATWPDMVRSQANPMSFTHNHPSWHYIDVPYAIDGQPVAEKPVRGDGPHNALEALKQCVEELRDPKVSDADKAVDLCWVEHLIGDIHQPLHAVSLYSKEFPDGDQGGNLEQVLRDPPYPDSAVKLHTLWDGMVGNFVSEDFDRIEATGLRGDERYSRAKMADLLKTTDFMDWINESHKLAIEYVYLNGTLKSAPARRYGDAPTQATTAPAAGSPAGVRRAGGPSTQPTTMPAFGRRRGASSMQSIPGLPPGYLANAEKVGMHQVTLAGYRLADQLNAIFDPKPEAK